MKVTAEIAIGVIALAALGYYVFSSVTDSFGNIGSEIKSDVESGASETWDSLTSLFEAAASPSAALGIFGADDFASGFGGTMDPNAGASGSW